MRLRNISAIRRADRSQVDFPDGVELLLDLGDGGQHFATVSWSRGDQAGLVFQAPFDLAVLAAAKPDVAPQRWDTPDLSRRSRRTRPRHGPTNGTAAASIDLRDDLEGFLKR